MHQLLFPGNRLAVEISTDSQRAICFWYVRAEQLGIDQLGLVSRLIRKREERTMSSELFRRVTETTIYEARRLNLQRDPRKERIIAKALAAKALAAIESDLDKEFSEEEIIDTMNDTDDINLERVCQRLKALGYNFSMQHVGGNIVYPMLVLENKSHLTITDEDSYSLIHSTPILEDGEVQWEDDEVIASGIKDDATIIATTVRYARSIDV